MYWEHSSLQSLSHVWLFATPWTAARQASLSITNSRSFLKPTSIESVMPSNHLIFCHPLLLLPPIPPSIRVFSNESPLLITWPKYWNFTLSISPSNEHSRLISFRMDWLDLLAVQGTLKSLLQHHSSKASIPQHSAFFTVQLSHPYTTTGKTIALTRRTFVGEVMSLLFNTYRVEGEKVWEDIYSPKEGALNLNPPCPGQRGRASSFPPLSPSTGSAPALRSASLPVLGFFSFSPYFNHLLASPLL